MKLLASYPFLKLYLHEGPHPVIEADWLGFASSSSLRAAIINLLDLARAHQAIGYVTNDLRLGPIRPADLEWVAEYALPVLVEIGVKRMARIETEDALNQLLIKNMLNVAQPNAPIDVRVFSDLDQARMWAGEPQ